MDIEEIMSVLEKLGSEQTKKVLKKHGAKEPFYGVKVADLKSMLVKKIKKNYELSLQLYDTGNSDAMYLAGLISEPDKMSKAQLIKWVQNAYWYFISEYTVAWVTSESRFGWELAQEWIHSNNEHIASAGWATLSSIVTIKKDEDLDIDALSKLIKHVEKTIHTSPNRVRYTMNGFIISVGSCVIPLKDQALKVANEIGKIQVDMGGTACKVPNAPIYIEKVEKMGRTGKKKKSAIC